VAVCDSDLHLVLNDCFKIPDGSVVASFVDAVARRCWPSDAELPLLGQDRTNLRCPSSSSSSASSRRYYPLPVDGAVRRLDRLAVAVLVSLGKRQLRHTTCAMYENMPTAAMYDDMVVLHFSSASRGGSTLSFLMGQSNVSTVSPLQSW
jgi:hypothetical protein